MEQETYRARLVSTAAATFLSLACGTNYVYSAWGPQFADRLNLSTTEYNVIGLGGNLGMYVVGIPVGMMVDSRGPRSGVLLGSAILGLGYFPLHRAYDCAAGSVALFFVLNFLTGLGGSLAFQGAVKSSALNWPRHRGTATALPVASFGLSAFFFSMIGTAVFPGDTSAFLSLLAFGTCGITFVCFFLVRVHPVTSPGPSPSSSSASSLPLPSPACMSAGGTDDRRSSGDVPWPRLGEDESRRRLLSSCPEPEPGSESGAAAAPVAPDTQPASADVRGFGLLRKVEFWQQWTIMLLLGGTGLMTINNIGNDVLALWRSVDPAATPRFLVGQQQMHVSILSLCSFAGRLLSGTGSDLLVKAAGASRLWCLMAAATAFAVAQACALVLEDPRLLGFVSGLSGLGYGCLFGVFPSIVVESFGVGGLSTNWGFMTLATILSSNVFNMLYGLVYDRHSRPGPDGGSICLDGVRCYRDAYAATLGACVLGAATTLAAIWYKRARAAKTGPAEGSP